jgi:ABC-2 type transport system ATP-binding protein
MHTPSHVVARLCGVTKRYGRFTALDGVDLVLQRGELLAVLGPNGAGKTTLIKMLCGLQEPSSGRAVVVGYDIRTQRWALRSSIGYMSQKFSLYGDLTVWQNLSFYAGLYGLEGQTARRRLQALVDLLGLGPYRLAQSASLPMGLRQRMALACALVHEPRLLFLDEPTSGVDPIARREFWNLVHGLASGAQVTVFVTTHYMDEASHCHRLGLMQQGHLIALDEPERLINRAQEEAGPLLTVNADDFSRAFQVLHEAFPDATLHGRRIQWQTRTLQQDQQKAEALLKQAGVQGHFAEVRLGMEEAFIHFVSTSGL